MSVADLRTFLETLDRREAPSEALSLRVAHYLQIDVPGSFPKDCRPLESEGAALSCVIHLEVQAALGSGTLKSACIASGRRHGLPEYVVLHALSVAAQLQFKARQVLAYADAVKKANATQGDRTAGPRHAGADGPPPAR
jgi:hypothetical protein